MTNSNPDTQFLFHCDSCTSNSSFARTGAEIVHPDEAGQTIVFYALCPEGHKIPVESEFAVIHPDIRSAAAALQKSIKRQHSISA